MHKIDIPDPSTMEIAPLNRFETIDLKKTALLVIDLQNGFVEKGQPLAGPYGTEIVPTVNRLAAAIRAAGGAVVFTRHTTSDEPPYALAPWQDAEGTPMHATKEYFRKGCYGHAIYAGLDVQPQDLVVDKYRFSAFIYNSSDIHERLSARGIDTLIVTGTLTNCCCESNARDANMMGYKVLFVTDATCTFSDAGHNAALLSLQAFFADVRNAEQMLMLIEDSKAARSATAG